MTRCRALIRRAPAAVRRLGIVCAAAVVAAAASAGPPAGTVPAARAAAAGPAPLARGWSRVFMTGTLSTVTPFAGTASLTPAAPGTANEFEGGAVWHTRPLTGTVRIHLLPRSMVLDTAAHAIAWDMLRSGDHAAMWGVMPPAGEIMVLSLVASTGRPAARPAAATAPAGNAVFGVVAARSGATLELVTDEGTRRAVLLTAATQVRRGDAASAETAIAPYDVVRVDGGVNSDGSLVAARLNVEYPAAAAAQLSGPIDAVHANVGGFVVAGTMVCTSAQTYFVGGVARLWMAQMTAGRPVTVYGVPIVGGGIPIGLAARVVVVR
jgi:hypothetical protein